jgi:hypothetical protein
MVMEPPPAAQTPPSSQADEARSTGTNGRQPATASSTSRRFCGPLADLAVKALEREMEESDPNKFAASELRAVADLVDDHFPGHDTAFLKSKIEERVAKLEDSSADAR